MRRKIQMAGVIGSGIMGGGIAALLAAAGVQTLLLDIVPFDLNQEEKNDPVARNRIVKSGLDAALLSQPPLFMEFKDAERITIGNLEDDLEKLTACDWIIEVIVENLKVKQDLLNRIESVRRPGTIVSTNTSGIPLKAMSEGLSRDFREHFLGTHFFNPVRYMKLLEIIPGEETLPEVLSFMAEYGEKNLGKGIVWAKDTPNFVGNRIGVHGIVKAMQLMLEDGLTIPEVDALFGPAMGRPKTAMFKTSDLVGLDTMAHVAKNTYDLVPDDEQRDSFVIPGFVEKMIEQKLLGNKTKAGFYKKDLTPEWEIIRKVIDPQTLEYQKFAWPTFPCLETAKKAKTLADKIRAVVYGDDQGSKFAWKVIANGLIYAANRIPEISDTVVEIDNAMKWGYNFEMGPFETWDAIGVAESVEKMDAEGYPVPDTVREMLAAGNTRFYKSEDGQLFYFDVAGKAYTPITVSPNIISLQSLKSTGKVVKSNSSASLIDLGDDVFCCEFHTRLNAINGEIVDFMTEIADFVEENGAGMVIGNQAGGMPGAFSAGGDLHFMGELAKAGKYSEIDAFVEKAQNSMQRARYAPFPIVAAPYGMTLGGGCEVCLGTADKIVAHADLYMGLVEIGVGLLPAGGGCLNLWKKFISNVPDAVTDTDLTKFFIPVFMNIAMAKFSNSAADARANGFLGPKDRIVMNRDYLIGEAKKEVLKLVDEGYAPPVKRNVKVVGETAQGMINSEIHNMREGKFISEYDAFLARRIAFVISGGDVRANSEIPEEVILKLEREAFVDFWKEEKTLARVAHMLKTGKPLRN
ncbi:3-hydroxyacyl-CoA dehydrogenase [fadN-fadA-fadE operon] (EC / Enoyl-CoA hydratase [fadN-fadA-fadE operon] (EC [Olavius algarvensis associated proteobacterium Delta 3]|nr:3-hydroxyacyl-CoA dehydrogenase [fadN-fadA-fadE operon] (EC / Enoyl-CoA hydratase [fadN-fadA-fadE operon] (EC [Olavius algarvensis associated proteobacterium Delta 3]CAB5116849.1 3-hydroxyacyl-CoA dehydrogenase [fadN-fadA-fadE operon] (EC / Enoyl-CoA hydratase [fadN-fadA-fadE operon] (EC [Olavius algarvensis associated proteobacterium Delta 3]